VFYKFSLPLEEDQVEEISGQQVVLEDLLNPALSQ